MSHVVFEAILCAIALTTTNFIYMGIRRYGKKTYSWSKAAERSYFQAIALAIFVFVNLHGHL